MTNPGSLTMGFAGVDPRHQSSWIKAANPFNVNFSQALILSTYLLAMYLAVNVATCHFFSQLCCPLYVFTIIEFVLLSQEAYRYQGQSFSHFAASLILSFLANFIFTLSLQLYSLMAFLKSSTDENNCP